MSNDWVIIYSRRTYHRTVKGEVIWRAIDTRAIVMSAADGLNQAMVILNDFAAPGEFIVFNVLQEEF
jgi:hypothetical protein